METWVEERHNLVNITHEWREVIRSTAVFYKNIWPNLILYHEWLFPRIIRPISLSSACCKCKSRFGRHTMDSAAYNMSAGYVH